MSKFNFAVYAEGIMYPDNSQQPVSTTLSQVQNSGFTTLILGLFHIGRNYSIQPSQIMGDIYFNNVLVISEGRYVGDPSWPALINGALDGTITSLCASIGGGGVMDFETLQKIYQQNDNSYTGTNLATNLNVLKQTFPAISIIDLDCEDNYDLPSFVAFCQLANSLGFDLTFCPYTYQQFWTSALQQLNNTNKGAVKWWNLQCYDGGEGNQPSQWAQAITEAVPGFDTTGFIVAGDWTNDSPALVQSLMKSFNGSKTVGGGFIWTLDQIVANDSTNPQQLMTAYVNAISVGLGNVL
jgi:hypothetical protein